MGGSRRRLVLAVAFLAATVPALGQTLGLQPGQRVRVQMISSEDEKIEGTVVGGDPIVLAIAVQKPKKLRQRGVVELPVGLMTKLQVTQGAKSRVWAGLAGGALIGATAGLWIAGDPDVPPDDSCGPSAWGNNCPYSSEQWRDIAIATAVGTGLGAAVGAKLKTDRWVDVPLSGRPRVSVTPLVGRRNGLQVAVSF